ncbi:hypothetical protein D3C74_276620 [compost metagenome]
MPESYSLAPCIIASPISSPAEDKRNSESASRIPVIPSSVRIAFTDSPSAPALPKPMTNDSNAAPASSRQAVWNAEEVIPAVLANKSRVSPPVSTLAPIRFIVIDMAEPPASASIPTDDIAADMPMICPSDKPICTPAPARRIDIAIISASVVAKLLPSPTSVEPSLSTSLSEVPVMFAKRAKLVAASSADKFVDSPKSIIVLVNPTMSAAPTPN